METHPHLPALLARADRARKHLDELEIEFQRYLKTNPHKFALDLDAQGTWHTAYVSAVESPAPPLLSVIAGEIAYQLHATLDNLVWALVLANDTHNPGVHNTFPVKACAADFWRDEPSQLRGVHTDAVKLIEQMQPYHGGHNPTEGAAWVLKSLAEKDKHRQLAACAVGAEIDSEAFRHNFSWNKGGVLEEFHTVLPVGAPLVPGTQVARLRIAPPNRDRYVKMKGQYPALIVFSDGEPGTALLDLDDSATWVRDWTERFEPFL